MAQRTQVGAFGGFVTRIYAYSGLGEFGGRIRGQAQEFSEFGACPLILQILLQFRCDLLLGKCLDDITDFDVVEIGDGETTFVSLSDFIHILLEAAQ